MKKSTKYWIIALIVSNGIGATYAAMSHSHIKQLNREIGDYQDILYEFDSAKTSLNDMNIELERKVIEYKTIADYEAARSKELYEMLDQYKPVDQ